MSSDGTVEVGHRAAAVRAGSPELGELLERISDGAAERERDRVQPFEQIDWIRQAGLGRLRTPVEDGGAGATVRELFQVVIDLAAADSNVAHILRAHYVFVEEQLASADAEARSRWLALVNQDKLFGSAVTEQNGQAVGTTTFSTILTPDPDGAGYRLSGEKFYSTGTLFSDWTRVWASTPDGGYAAVTIPVDREGVTLEDDWDGFGQRLTGSGTTRLRDVFVHPDEAALYDSPDSALGGWSSTYHFAFVQLYLQALTAGILKATQIDAVSLVRRRSRNFSHAATELPSNDRQVLEVVGEIAADAFAAEAIVLHAADRIQEAADSVVDGVPAVEPTQRAQIAAAKAKVAVDRFSYQTATRLFDAGGASAIQAAHNLDRHWRNARAISTHNPTFLKASWVGDFHVNGTPPPENGFF